MKKPTTKDDKEHLGRVAALGCVICGCPANVHHMRTGKGMGQRASHYETFPLCHYHHQGSMGIHHMGTKAWQAMFGRELDFVNEVNARLGVKAPN